MSFMLCCILEKFSANRICSPPANNLQWLPSVRLFCSLTEFPSVPSRMPRRRVPEEAVPRPAGELQSTRETSPERLCTHCGRTRPHVAADNRRGEFCKNCSRFLNRSQHENGNCLKSKKTFRKADGMFFVKHLCNKTICYFFFFKDFYFFL